MIRPFSKSEHDIIYMFTMAGLRAGRIRCELHDLGEAFKKDNWNVIVPMMNAIEDWNNRNYKINTQIN